MRSWSSEQRFFMFFTGLTEYSHIIFRIIGNFYTFYFLLRIMDKNLPEPNEKDEWKRNASETGLRLFFIFLFGFILYFTIIFTLALVMFQLGHKFITGSPNLKLQNFSHDLAIFMHRILDYLNFNSDQKPFPFDEWPSSNG